MSTYCFFHKGCLPSKTGLRRLRSEMFLYTSTLYTTVGSIRPLFDSPRLKRNEAICLQNVSDRLVIEEVKFPLFLTLSKLKLVPF